MYYFHQHHHILRTDGGENLPPPGLGGETRVELKDLQGVFPADEGVLRHLAFRDNDNLYVSTQWNNTGTSGDVIASDLSLYETALGVVRLLNSGSYANNQQVQELFAADDAYTSHRMDALRYKAKMNKAMKLHEGRDHDIYQSRYQASLDRCMQAKHTIKRMVGRA